MMKVCLLGASGSIGKQTIDVMEHNPNDFDLVAFSIGKKVQKIKQILAKYPNVKHICLQDDESAKRYQKKYPNIRFYNGDNGLNDLIINSKPDIVVNALVGFVGLKPTLTALENNLIVCLANKEALVVGGELVNKLLDEGHGRLYPIDSEHVALAKCLSVDSEDVDQLIITASGGAFRKLTREQLVDVKANDALNHPTWKMGSKITIDCATMVNKTFEVIEAHYLFRYPIDRIAILLHDESLVHSLVKYNNGFYRLDYGKPDMRVPIKWALYQGLTDFKTELVSDYHVYKKCHFHEFDLARYPVVKWAKVVIKDKGTYGAVLNAANEVAVRAYLKDEIPFLMIEQIIDHFMDTHKNINHPTYETIELIDSIIRKQVKEYIKGRKQ